MMQLLQTVPMLKRVGLKLPLFVWLSIRVLRLEIWSVVRSFGKKPIWDLLWMLYSVRMLESVVAVDTDSTLLIRVEWSLEMALCVLPTALSA